MNISLLDSLTTTAPETPTFDAKVGLPKTPAISLFKKSIPSTGDNSLELDNSFLDIAPLIADPKFRSAPDRPSFPFNPSVSSAFRANSTDTTESNPAIAQTTNLGPDLKVEIIKTILPETVDYGADGRVTLEITNRGDTTFRGPATFNLYISTDDNIDHNPDGSLRNDGLLTALTNATFTSKAGATTRITLNYDSQTSVIAQGAYNLIAEIETPNQPDPNLRNNVSAQQVSAVEADPILQWNGIGLNAIQSSGETGPGVGPTVGSRLMAIVSAAAFDTVNAYSHDYQSYAIDRDAPMGSSQAAAIAGAAFEVLRTLLPSQRRYFRTQLNRFLDQTQDSRFAERKGLQFGRSIGRDILTLRADDGANDNTPFTPPRGAYGWKPDAPNFTVLGQNWGNVTPFGIDSVENFSPDGLFGRPRTGNAARTQAYINDIEEVRRLGGKADTPVTTITRTADQTEQAIFWAYDRADTFRPYGHLNQITQEIALRERNTVSENARLFALLNIALADSAIVAWRAKFDELQPRPDDVISGDGQGRPFAERDGLEETVADFGWKPLLEDLIPNSPPFPDYISGHSTFGAAFGGVLGELYGEDYQFPVVSQELIGAVRNFNGFAEAGFEDAISRLYGGVHVREAITDGVSTGERIGQFVASTLLQPI